MFTFLTLFANSSLDWNRETPWLRGFLTRFNAEQASYAESIRQNAVTEHDRIEKEWIAEKEKVNQSEVDKQATRQQL